MLKYVKCCNICTVTAFNVFSHVSHSCQLLFENAQIRSSCSFPWDPCMVYSLICLHLVDFYAKCRLKNHTWILCAYIWLILLVNVGKHTIHGSYGFGKFMPQSRSSWFTPISLHFINPGILYIQWWAQENSYKQGEGTPFIGGYEWWFRNPAFTSWGWQLIYHYLPGLDYIPGGCSGFVNHQQYEPQWNSIVFGHL